MAASAADAPLGRFRRHRSLVLRILSAVILGPLMLAAIWFGFPWIDLVAAVAAPLLISEWIGLTRGRPVLRLLTVAYTLAAIIALLWQCAYAELVFVDTLWPDFGKDHLEQAIAEFRRRERRYGGVGG